jgi:5-methylcytosine-specific restriction endonuclease McrA
MVEIRAWAANELGVAHSQIDRRVRSLREHFDVPVTRIGGTYRYVLRGWSVGHAQSGEPTISDRIRAEVLAPGRCAQCGRTPLVHGVVLVVDHKIPRAWGGGNEIENLQPLCEDCNHGKRDYYSSYDAHAAKIAAAIRHEEPHRRIGELLKAFDGAWVPGDLVGIVASAIQYQEDWQKRTRELRTLGWRIDTQKRHNEGYKVRTYYRVSHWENWPSGSISAEIRRLERENKERRAAAKGRKGRTS